MSFQPVGANKPRKLKPREPRGLFRLKAGNPDTKLPKQRGPGISGRRGHLLQENWIRCCLRAHAQDWEDQVPGSLWKATATCLVGFHSSPDQGVAAHPSQTRSSFLLCDANLRSPEGRSAICPGAYGAGEGTEGHAGLHLPFLSAPHPLSLGTWEPLD